jgi:hypothetical protein
MEQWRKAWRRGFVLQLTVADLSVLRKALADDDPRLIQGATTDPPQFTPTPNFRRGRSAETPVCGACLIGFCGWLSRGLRTIGEVKDFYTVAFETADVDVDAYPFIRWFDDSPRERVRVAMLAEVERELLIRAGVPVVDPARPRKTSRSSRKLVSC